MPSFVSVHWSEVSFHRTSTSADVPRSTLIPASTVGAPVKSVLRLILLSTIFTCVVFTELIVPVTLRADRHERN